MQCMASSNGNRQLFVRHRLGREWCPARRVVPKMFFTVCFVFEAFEVFAYGRQTEIGRYHDYFETVVRYYQSILKAGMMWHISGSLQKSSSSSIAFCDWEWNLVNGDKSLSCLDNSRPLRSFASRYFRFFAASILSHNTIFEHVYWAQRVLCFLKCERLHACSTQFGDSLNKVTIFVLTTGCQRVQALFEAQQLAWDHDTVFVTVVWHRLYAC